MKKTVMGCAILALIFAACLINISYQSRILSDIEEYLSDAESHLLSGQADMAEQSVLKAIDYWNSLEGYTHVFIRHTDIDAASDAFYDLLSELGNDPRGSLMKLRARLDSIRKMERLSIGSIF